MNEEQETRQAMSEAGPVLPGEQCGVPPHESWSELEKWMWQEIGSGRIADINQKLGWCPISRYGDDWRPDRRLSPAFLETILLHDPWRSAIPRHGVRIVGALLDEALDLADAELLCELWLDRSLLATDSSFQGVRTSHSISLEGSTFGGALNLGFLELGGQVNLSGAKVAGRLGMSGASIGHDLFMSGGAEFSEVDLGSAKIEGVLDLSAAKVAGRLSMSSASIGHDLFMSGGAEFSEVDLGSAKIEGGLDLSAAKVTGTLGMNWTSVGQSLLMSAGAEFAEIELIRAKIEGVLDLSGAKVTATLGMNSASIGRDLFMSGGAEFSEVELVGAEIRGVLDLSGAKITGKLDMNSASVGQSLIMRHGAEFTEIDLGSAKIEGVLDLSGAKVTRKLSLSGASIGKGLFMRQGAEFAEVDLLGAKIEGQLSLEGAKVKGKLGMNSASVGQSLLMRQGAEFNEVDLVGVKIGGQLSLIKAAVIGELNLESANIGSHLLMRDGRFEDIRFVFGRVGGGLNVSGATLATFNLTGTEVAGELHLSSRARPPTWAAGAELKLRNARVDTIQDEAEAWPAKLDLDGFTYGRFGGIGAEADAAISHRGSNWFVSWLGKDEPYTPQPYHQCANILRAMGHPEMADDVLYAGRERERVEAWQRAKSIRDYARAAGLLLLKSTVGYGYGYRYFRALEWVLLFVLLGIAVLLLSSADKVAGTIVWSAQGVFTYLLALGLFSLDLLLPIIELHKPHYNIVLDGMARYYFAFHKLMGYALASFLIAGLAGLTK